MNDTNIILPKWYQSTAGPQISSTIMNIVGNVLPIVNMFLASKGWNILPASVNGWISLAVFGFFSLRAGLSYIRAKQFLGAQIRRLKDENEELGAKLGAASVH